MPSKSEVIMLIGEAHVLHFSQFSSWWGRQYSANPIDPRQPLKLILPWLRPKNFTRVSDSLTAASTPPSPPPCSANFITANPTNRPNSIYFMSITVDLCIYGGNFIITVQVKTIFQRLWQITTSQPNESHIYGSFSLAGGKLYQRGHHYSWLTLLQSHLNATLGMPLITKLLWTLT